MNWKRCAMSAAALALSLIFWGCGPKEKIDEAAAAPPKAQVAEEPDLNIVKVDRPERFRLVSAARREALPEIHATGVINPDIEKSVPVISLASGRVVGIYAKIGDDVHKGQLLLKVLSNDISNAFQTYRQAIADEELARKQLERAQLLYAHGAISLNDLEVAEDTEQKAKVARDIGAEELQTFGADPNHPDPVLGIRAPIDGTIVEQNVVSTSVVHTPDNQPNIFTIANLSTVWVICNVYENDLPDVHLGDTADVQLNAYENRTFHGRINNIGKVLDSNIRTAPVRIILTNPGMMRVGMFVTATLYRQHGVIRATVPATAVLHLHDKDWVFTPSGQGQFRRTAIMAGRILDGREDVISGVLPGQQVVNDALALSAESEQ